MIKKINKSSFDTGAFDFKSVNKRYYQEKENYDWVSVTDNIKGLESFFHRFREKGTVALINKFGRGEKYFDAGCGTGLILRHCPKNSVGLDINPRNIEKAREYLPETKLILGDIENIPLNDNFFSTVICTEVFEHLPDPRKALNEIIRVLEPGGVLIGTVPKVNIFWRLRVLSSTHPGEPYHKEYKKNEISGLFSGRKIISLKPINLSMTWSFVLEK
jgi:ubiquinone/menaquinone biosynthesis C-methylase UbiE